MARGAVGGAPGAREKPGLSALEPLDGAKKPISSALGPFFGSEKPGPSALEPPFGPKKPSPSALGTSFRRTRHVFSWDLSSVTGGKAHFLLGSSLRHRWQSTFPPVIDPPSAVARHVFSSATSSVTGLADPPAAVPRKQVSRAREACQSASAASSAAASSGACSRAQGSQIGARSRKARIAAPGSSAASQHAQGTPGATADRPAT